MEKDQDMKRILPKTLSLAAAAILALAAGSAAVAQQPRGPLMFRGDHGPGGFGLLEFDTNADGKLAKAEFDAAQRTRFDGIDGNKDGFIVPDEMRASFESRRANAEKERFALLDADKNGQLSQSEFDAARERGPGRGPDVPRLRMGPGGPDGPRGPGGPGPGGFGRGDRPGPDADNDGKISFAEFSARGAEGFTRADANKDGTVTIAELQALSRGPR
jgi:hypothetical protein